MTAIYINHDEEIRCALEYEIGELCERLNAGHIDQEEMLAEVEELTSRYLYNKGTFLEQ